MQWINFTDKKIILLFMVNVYLLPYNEVPTTFFHEKTNSEFLQVFSIAQLDCIKCSLHFFTNPEPTSANSFFLEFPRPSAF